MRRGTPINICSPTNNNRGAQDKTFLKAATGTAQVPCQVPSKEGPLPETESQSHWHNKQMHLPPKRDTFISSGHLIMHARGAALPEESRCQLRRGPMIHHARQSVSHLILSVVSNEADFRLHNAARYA